jgi:FG-GAP-like repeat
MVTLLSSWVMATERFIKDKCSGRTPSGRNSPIIALDLNGDQHLDLVVANSIDHSFSVLLGNGDGTFQPPVAYTVQGEPQSVFAADLTGDGRKDLVVFGGYLVSNWFGNGDGTFRFGSSSTTRYGILVGDFNGDKIDDLVARPFVLCIFNCKPVAPLLWLSGTSEPPFPVGQGVVAAGDFDGDGKLDLVGIGAISPGNGDGTFQPQISLPVSDSEAQVLDVNGDGAPDLVLIQQNAINLLVNTGTDFSISASALNPGTLSTGQSANSSLTLKLLSNFDNPVALTCAVQPAQTGAPTCSLSSSSVTFDASGEASATLTISAGSSGAAVNHYRPFSKSSSLWFPMAGFAFLATGFGVGTSRRRHFVVLLIGAVLFIGIILQTACGGGSNSVPKSTADTITITGTAASVQHSTTVSLTLQ